MVKNYLILLNLREGSMGVKMYYEIAKEAYLEGVANGLKL